MQEIRLEPFVLQARENLETRFIFRKLGLCFDYASDPADFPRSTLPNAREARDGLPSAAGHGSGIASSAINGALLFDGYLLRLELGIGQPDDERVFDRLVGGLIRIATVAPKGFLVRGLTPDGRGFYPCTDSLSHLFWAFSAWRAVTTPALAIESQDKVRNIAGKWIQRLARDDWRLPDESLLEDDWRHGPLLLALLAVGWSLTADERWKALLDEKKAENGGRRLSPEISTDASALDLLALQVALHLLVSIEPDKEVRTALRQQQLRVVERAVPILARFHELQPDLLDEPLNPDWRAQPAEALADPRSPLPWPRLANEQHALAGPAQAALAILLSARNDRAAPVAPLMEELLEKTPWAALGLADSLAPVLAVHARGVEMGLWDPGLLEKPMSITAQTLVDTGTYLRPEYDEQHPEAAGHNEPPEKAPEEKSGRRRRGRRRDGREGGGAAAPQGNRQAQQPQQRQAQQGQASEQQGQSQKRRGQGGRPQQKSAQQAKQPSAESSGGDAQQGGQDGASKNRRRRRRRKKKSGGGGESGGAQQQQ